MSGVGRCGKARDCCGNIKELQRVGPLRVTESMSVVQVGPAVVTAVWVKLV
jgi:hypothetical protein